MKQHVLYRMYDEHDELLYVGLTNNPKGRVVSHSYTANWWTQVTTIRLEHFNSREEVTAAEVAAVRAEKPLYNVQLTPFTTAWCRAEGHVGPKQKRCEQCEEDCFYQELHRKEERAERTLAQDVRHDQFTRSYLGIAPPKGERNLTPEEMRSHPAWQRFCALWDDDLGAAPAASVSDGGAS